MRRGLSWFNVTALTLGGNAIVSSLYFPRSNMWTGGSSNTRSPFCFNVVLYQPTICRKSESAPNK